MEELKLCPLKSNRTMCQRTDCAFWIKKPGTEGCAIAVLAESAVGLAQCMEAVSDNLCDIALNGGT